MAPECPHVHLQTFCQSFMCTARSVMWLSRHKRTVCMSLERAKFVTAVNADIFSNGLICFMLHYKTSSSGMSTDSPKHFMVFGEPKGTVLIQTAHVNELY